MTKRTDKAAANFANSPAGRASTEARLKSLGLPRAVRPAKRRTSLSTQEDGTIELSWCASDQESGEHVFLSRTEDVAILQDALERISDRGLQEIINTFGS